TNFHATVLGWRRTGRHWHRLGHSRHHCRTRLCFTGPIYHTDPGRRALPRTTALTNYCHHRIFRGDAFGSGPNHFCRHDHIHGVVADPLLYRQKKGWPLWSCWPLAPPVHPLPATLLLYLPSCLVSPLACGHYRLLFWPNYEILGLSTSWHYGCPPGFWRY